MNPISPILDKDDDKLGQLSGKKKVPASVHFPQISVSLCMKLEVPQIDPVLWLRLNMEAKHRGLAVSELLLEALHQFLGLPSAQSLAEKPSDFDRLAGTWTQEEAAEFERNTAAFGNIDPAMWE